MSAACIIKLSVVMWVVTQQKKKKKIIQKHIKCNLARNKLGCFFVFGSLGRY